MLPADYFDLGYHLFPCKWDKSPCTPNGFKDAVGTLAEFEDLCRRFPGPNVGMVIPEGVMVLDLDIDPAEGKQGIEAMQHIHPGWNPLEHDGPIQRTPRTGLHLFACAPPGMKGNSTGSLPVGVDVRGNGRGYTCVCPSQTEDGYYDWVAPLVDPFLLNPLPEWISDLILTPKAVKREPTKVLALPSGICRGAECDRWVKRARAWSAKAFAGWSEDMGSADKRHETLLGICCKAGSLIAGGLCTEDEAIEAIRRAAEGATRKMPELERTIRDGIRYGSETPRRLEKCERCGFGERNKAKAELSPPSRLELLPGQAKPAEAGPATVDPEPEDPPEVGNTDERFAEEFLAVHGDSVLFRPEEKCWYVWSGKIWRKDDDLSVERLASSLARERYAVALDELKSFGKPDKDDEDGKAYQARLKAELKFWEGRLNVRGINSGLEAACKYRSIMADQMDSDPWLLNVQNGTVDLRTGQLHPHRPQDYNTRIATASYDPSAPPAREWESFLEWALPNHSVRELVQRWCGYCLTGVVREHVFFTFVGTGRNGKGTLLETLAAVLGEYSGILSADRIAQRRTDQTAHPEDLADLRGRRMVLSSEPAAGATLDVAMMKHLTGGDRIRAHRMHENGQIFSPTHKLGLITNHRPRVSDFSDAVWRRMVEVRFQQQISEDKEDPELPAKLKSEGTSILSWAIAGCTEWHQRGLAIPRIVREWTGEYKEEEDMVGQWFDEGYKRTESDEDKIRATDLFSDFTSWQRDQGISERNTMTMTRFGRELTSRGLSVVKKSGTKHRGRVRKRNPSDRTDDTVQVPRGINQENLPTVH